MSKERPGKEAKPRRLSLEVPQNVNLSQMSDDEIERLALDMSRKMASTLPKGTVLAGVEGVTLNQNRPGVGVEVGWSRACGRAELTREGLVVNPEVFTNAIRVEELAGKSARIAIKSTPGLTKGAAKKKK